MSTNPVQTVPSTDSFGARLALVRWQMGWNQREASLACNLPHSSWRQWELSGSLPRNYQEVCEKIAGRTGIPLLWVMAGREDAPQPGRPEGEAGEEGIDYRTVSRLRVDPRVDPRVQGEGRLAEVVVLPSAA